MFDRSSLEELLLQKEVGVFNNQTNTNGAVRDHIYSRRSGFENSVFPELLRHPVNCQIITHGENVAKKRRKYIDGDNMTLQDLFLKIKIFSGNWDEQELCLELIQKYENGSRWQRKE